MTRFWWVRHAPTHARAFAGWRDIAADLSDTAALGRLDAFLPARAALISSDLIRAVATADALSKGRDRLPHDAALREFHFGDWDGLDFAAVATGWPDLSRRYWEEPGHVAPPGGESWCQAAERVDAVVSRLCAAPPAADIVIVAHFGVILTQVARALDLCPYEALAQPIDNLSVTQLTHDGRQWRAGPVNHLA